ncbi:hypothetical protein TNCV_2923891 [Trichonephila clavipes]|nr:hypothetical protein TNCV_2923891 [Trichonephila clavipes]
MCSTYPAPRRATHSKHVKIQQRQSAGCPPTYVTTLGVSHLSIPTDWMDEINTSGEFNIPTAKSLLESNMESKEPIVLDITIRLLVVKMAYAGEHNSECNLSTQVWGVWFPRMASNVEPLLRHGVSEAINHELGYSVPLFQRSSFQFLERLWWLAASNSSS